MTWDLRHLLAEHDDDDLDRRGRPAPGKVTLTRGFPGSVQRRAAAPRVVGTPAEAAPARGLDDPFGVHLEAARGLEQPSTQLPFLDRIQASFGLDHDVSQVQSHVGGQASVAADAIGATAYATGNHVVFGGAPDLHTAAHEAAHVVQQRGGVQLKGGVGEAGDVYERHADEVADRVVRGESAADLLSGYGGSLIGATGTVQRRPKGQRGPADDAPAVDPDFERMLLEVLDRPVKAGDQDAADERYIEFQGLILNIEEDTAAALHARLSVAPPPASDRLARGFHRFSTKNRRFILERLAGGAAAYRPVKAGDQGGDVDMWKELAPGETTKEVHFLGRIDAPKGVYLREHPDGAPSRLLPFDTLVSVERETQRGWYYVVALGDSANGGTVTGTGFIENHAVAQDPPEPTAHLYLVKPGDMLKDIAAAYYKHGFTWGNDARVYVQALYHANKGRDAVFRQNADLTVDRRALETDDLHEAHELWAAARVVSGQALWIPSHEFVAQLKASGVIHHASIKKEIMEDIWNSTVGVLEDAIDWAQYAAGFTVGLLEGAFGALKDLFMGAVDLVKLLWTAIKDIVGGFSELKALAKKLSAAWKGRKGIMEDVATNFMDKWENKADYPRGNFQGEFLGYVMMLAFITLVTVGEGAVVVGAGRFGSFIKVIQLADAAGDIGTYARKLKNAIKLPAHAVDEAGEVLASKTRKVQVEAPTKHGPDDPDAPDEHGTPDSTRVDAAHAPDADAPTDRARPPYADPNVDPTAPRRPLEKRELVPHRKLDVKKSWKEIERTQRKGDLSFAVGAKLASADDGHAVLARLARGDVSALEKLGISDYPKDLDPSGREWALIEVRDGFVVYAGGYRKVDLPVNARVLGHTHPGPDPSVRDPDMGPAVDRRLDAGENGRAFEDVLSDLDNARNSGIVPSAADIHAISDGTPHVLYTRYVHAGDGRVANPLPGDTRPRVQIHMRDAKVVRWNSRRRSYHYEVQVVVRDAAGKEIWSGPMYAAWHAQLPGGDVFVKRPALLDRPPSPEWQAP